MPTHRDVYWDGAYRNLGYLPPCYLVGTFLTQAHMAGEGRLAATHGAGAAARLCVVPMLGAKN